jgi:carbon-monoxide dehydrogenase large subunit
VIGEPVTRREDERVLRGQTRYLDDIELPGLAHVAFVRSPFAHATIAGIRAPEPGGDLLAVVSAADLGERVRSFPIQTPEGEHVAAAPHPVLARDKVAYVGQPVAAVIAPSRPAAEDGAELVEVDYEPLPVVVEPADSRDELVRWSRCSGDVEAAFASAAHVVQGSYALPRLVATPIEARGCVADYDAGRDLLTVWCSAQDVHRPLAQLAHILRRPADRIRLIVPDVGGAFGGKGVIAPEVAATAQAAIDLGRPLKWTEDRLENFLAAYQGRGIAGELSLALDEDGAMLALRASLRADLGAYLLTTTPVPPHTAATLLTGCYAIPAAEVTVVGVRTNKVPTGPYRGAGRPDAAYMLERLVDDAARAVGIDRIELRRRNLIRRFPHRTPLGLTYDSGDYEGCLDAALSLLAAAPSSDPSGPDHDRVRGTGVAMFVERAGGQWESATVEVEPDGRLVVSSSSSPHGQGHETTFAQIAAGRLGVALETVALRFGDSASSPRGVGTFGSRSVAMAGSAITVAIDRLIVTARRLAAHLLSVPLDEVSWEEGGAVTGGRSLSLAELAAAALQPARLPESMDVGLRAGATFRSGLVFSSGAYGAVVEIERSTGRLHVLRVAAVDDSGTVINPLLAHGQVLGGSVQALGECLGEEMIYDDSGQPRSASLLDYSLLTAAEIPPILTGEVSTPSPLNPLGAKGVGEGGAIGTLAAVANAVAGALSGVHVDPPFADEKLWRALQ